MRDYLFNEDKLEEAANWIECVEEEKPDIKYFVNIQDGNFQLLTGEDRRGVVKPSGSGVGATATRVNLKKRVFTDSGVANQTFNYFADGEEHTLFSADRSFQVKIRYSGTESNSMEKHLKINANYSTDGGITWTKNKAIEFVQGNENSTGFQEILQGALAVDLLNGGNPTFPSGFSNPAVTTTKVGDITFEKARGELKIYGVKSASNSYLSFNEKKSLKELFDKYFDGCLVNAKAIKGSINDVIGGRAPSLSIETKRGKTAELEKEGITGKFSLRYQNENWVPGGSLNPVDIIIAEEGVFTFLETYLYKTGYRNKKAFMEATVKYFIFPFSLKLNSSPSGVSKENFEDPLQIEKSESPISFSVFPSGFKINFNASVGTNDRKKWVCFRYFGEIASFDAGDIEDKKGKNGKNISQVFAPLGKGKFLLDQLEKGGEETRSSNVLYEFLSLIEKEEITEISDLVEAGKTLGLQILNKADEEKDDNTKKSTVKKHWLLDKEKGVIGTFRKALRILSQNGKTDASECLGILFAACGKLKIDLFVNYVYPYYLVENQLRELRKTCLKEALNNTLKKVRRLLG